MYIDENSRVVVQGITGNQGSFHTKLMLDYGTKVVAGVNPGKGGQEVHGVPVFNKMKEAKVATGYDTSIVFVPAEFAFGAVKESIYSGTKITCIITENVPVFDMLKLIELAQEKNLYLIGPNCPGMLIPGKIKLGIISWRSITP